MTLTPEQRETLGRAVDYLSDMQASWSRVYSESFVLERMLALMKTIADLREMIKEQQ